MTTPNNKIILQIAITGHVEPISAAERTLLLAKLRRGQIATIPAPVHCVKSTADRRAS
jgi:hypothetical protein